VKPAAAPAVAAAPEDPEKARIEARLDELTAQLAQIPLFKDVSLKKHLANTEQKKEIVANPPFRVQAPKSVVCREGDFTSEFFVVLSGLVDVHKQAGESLKYLATLSQNAWFGEMSCMSSAPRAATVTAQTDVVLLVLPRHMFMAIYEKCAPFKKTVDAAYRERALANHLSGVSLFRGVRESVLKKIADVAELVVVEKSAPIVQEGDPGDAFFLVRTGHAKVTRGEEIVAWLCENSFFGEVALLEDKPRTSTVTAMDRMDLVRIPKAPFLALLDEFPDVKTTVLSRVRRIYDTEFLSDEEAVARERATEIGTEHEVVKAGEALVIDMSKCTRCNMCVTGCIEAHEDRIPRIGKRGIQYGDLLLTSSCYNCKVPDCMLACKYGAIRRDRRGQVIIDPLSCVGCAQCEPACPYGTIHMQSFVEEDGLELKASPVSRFLGSLPVLGKVFARGKPTVAQAAEKAEDPVVKAVKCDLCAGRGDMACIYNCPCGAIERIDPSVLLS
jgi:CRP-like cAMP-binding protein/Fe-S-cluster-containing dehydrogenase component